MRQLKVLLSYPSDVKAIEEMLKTHVVLEEASGSYDLVIFPGYDEIDPRRHGIRDDFVHYDEERDRKELQLLCDVYYEKIRAGKVICIDRGFQLLNSFFGGRVLRNGFRHKLFHQIVWEVPTILSPHIKEVNSLHKRIITDSVSFAVLAREVSTLSPEVGHVIYRGGTPRSVEILGMMFHPELLSNSDDIGRIIKEWTNGAPLLTNEKEA